VDAVPVKDFVARSVMINQTVAKMADEIQKKGSNPRKQSGEFIKNVQNKKLVVGPMKQFIIRYTGKPKEVTIKGKPRKYQKYTFEIKPGCYVQAKEANITDFIKQKGKPDHRYVYANYELKGDVDKMYDPYELQKIQEFLSHGTALSASSHYKHVNEVQLREEAMEIHKDAKERLPNKVVAAQEAADKFFKPENNAIVRSFESTRGRGLAGFITSLSFDYSDSTWSTDDEGSRAPKSVGITMAFAPIHDMPVGLDHTGRMRALSHPVGGIAARSDDIGDSFGDVYTKKEAPSGNSKYDSQIKVLADARQGTNTTDAGNG